jgi:hypothetical protein
MHMTHDEALRAQGNFALTDKLELISPVNPWKPGSYGDQFYKAALARNPATVQDAITLAAPAGFSAADVQGHLRWLYTWGGEYLRVNGERYQQA